MASPEEIVRFMHYSERLKTELRNASKSDKNRESVADHCWRLSLMLVLVLPKLTIQVDPLKVLKMAIVHDLVEIEARDVPILESVDNDERSKAKQKDELSAIKHIRKMLGDGGKDVYDLFMEFEELQTNEARVVRALDWLEGQMQFLSEDVTSFTEADQPAIQKLFQKTADLCKVDPFITELDRITLLDRQNRVKY